jgi:hypothetical protein
MIVEPFFRNRSSVVSTLREFRTALDVKRTPTDKAIRRWATVFLQTDSVVGSKISDYPNSTRNIANIMAVKEDVTRSPKKSARRRSSPLTCTLPRHHCVAS